MCASVGDNLEIFIIQPYSMCKRDPWAKKPDIFIMFNKALAPGPLSIFCLVLGFKQMQMNVHSMTQRILLHLEKGFITAPLSAIGMKLDFSPPLLNVLCQISANTFHKRQVLIHAHDLLVNSCSKARTQRFWQASDKFITIIINSLVLIQVQRAEYAADTSGLISSLSIYHFFTDLCKTIRVVTMQYSRHARRCKAHAIIITSFVMRNCRQLIKVLKPHFQRTVWSSERNRGHTSPMIVRINECRYHQPIVIPQNLCIGGFLLNAFNSINTNDV